MTNMYFSKFQLMLSIFSILQWQNKKKKYIFDKMIVCMHHFEIHDICSFINKIYSNKNIAPNNK